MLQIVGGNDLMAAISGGVYELIDVVEISGEELTVSPALIIATHLIENTGIVFWPSDKGDSGWEWPLYISSMPDIKDNCGAIYDTPGVSDGRLMAGEVIEHQGLQIKIRFVDYQDGWVKINEIAAALDVIHNEEITIGAITYNIQSLTRRSEPAYLGLESGTSRRNLFSINYTVTIKEV